MLLTTTAAAEDAEPVTVAEVKEYLRVFHTADDALLGALITSAREYVELMTGRALAVASYRYVGKLKQLSLWPADIGDVSGLESDGVTWTLLAANTDFTYDADRNLIVGSDYCTHKIEFTTAPGDAIQQPLKDAIKLRVQADYEMQPDKAEQLRSAAAGLVFPLRLNLGV